MEETIELAYDTFQYKDTELNLSPILLLHGLFWNKFMFKDLAEQLCRKTKRKVFCVDLRNHGESAVREKCDIYAMTEDVIKFIQDRDLKKVSFVCHSFSSTLAYILALKQPDTVEKIVMIDCHPFILFKMRYYTEYVEGCIIIQNRLLNRLKPEMSLIEAQAQFNQLASLGTKAQEFFYKKAAYELTKEDGKFKWKVNFEFLRKTHKNGGFTPELTNSSDHKILICRSVNTDIVLDEKIPYILKMCPNAKVVTFKDTSHLLMFEKQEDFILSVKNFFTE